MNLSCKHLKTETHAHREIGGGPIKETFYDCGKNHKELGTLKPCTYARDGKSLKECLNFEKK